MKTPIMIGGQKIGRLRASFLLFKESWRFLRADKELLLVPIFSTVFSLIVIGLLTVLLVTLSPTYDKFATLEGGMGYSEYLFTFAVYIGTAFSLAIGQAIIVHIVYVRAHGGNATLGGGIARAFSNWLPLLLWAILTSTVGMVLRFISERSVLVGRLVASLLGTAWAILTFFVVPTIVLQQQSPFRAVSSSATLFKKTWGETLVANVALGAVFMLAHFVVLASFAGLLIYGASTQNAVLLVGSIVGVLVWLLVATLVNVALQGILRTLLYIYAAEDMVPSNFNRELLESMLVRNTSVPPAAPVPNTFVSSTPSNT